MQALLSHIAARYQHHLATRPLLTKCTQGAVIATSGDVLAQTVFGSGHHDDGKGKKSGYDYRRTLALGAWAFCYSGPFSHMWFRGLDRYITSPGWTGVVKKVIMDVWVVGIPNSLLFFGALGAMEGKNKEQIVDNIQRNFWPTQIACYKLWPAVQLITFSVIPLELRPLFTGCVAFGWSIFLSLSFHRPAATADAHHAKTAQPVLLAANTLQSHLSLAKQQPALEMERLTLPSASQGSLPALSRLFGRVVASSVAEPMTASHATSRE